MGAGQKRKHGQVVSAGDLGQAGLMAVSGHSGMATPPCHAGACSPGAKGGKGVLSRCPECGGYLVRQGYCFCCVVCGWGECG